MKLIKSEGLTCQLRFYLSPIPDLFNGEVIRYRLTGSPSFVAIIEMLKKASRRLPEKIDLIPHSDRGWQYQMKHYQRLSAERRVSRKGNCHDNAVIENFFGSLKTEFFDNRTFKDEFEFQNQLIAYLDYCNRERNKVKLKGLSLRCLQNSVLMFYLISAQQTGYTT